MKAEAKWLPSKFELVHGRLIPTSNTSELGVGSRLIGQLQARTCQFAIERYARGRLVDLGCGSAPLYAVYRPLVTEITCIDQPGSGHDHKHVDVEADLNLAIPLPDACVDTVLSTDVLEHIKEPRTLWDEIARVLAPGGTVIVTVPFLYWLHDEPQDYFRYSRYRLQSYCDELGLAVLELREYGGPLAVVMDVIGKNLPLGGDWFSTLARWFHGSQLGQRIDARKRGVFPIGYLLVAQKPA